MDSVTVNMERLLVHIIVALLRERFEANGAGKCSLSGVYPLMVLQVILAEEGLPTLRALVVFATRMLRHVHAQVVLMDERLAALVARERSYILVTAYVRLQVLLTREAAHA